MAVKTTGTQKETTEVGVGPAIDAWTGQYKKSWNGIITSESFSHPAKFARGLIETIIDHALEEGWVKPGDHCIDPFGGIATGAYACISKGLRWTGVELEEHFHNLGQGCDCTGMSKQDYARLYGRWPRMRYAHGHYICPRCLAQVAQVTGERRPTQRTFRTVPQAGRKVKTRTVAFTPLPFPDRHDGYGPPPHAQSLFAQETASYARSSGVIPCTQPHHYTGNIEAWKAKGYTGATLLKGDSRNLAAIIQAHADLAVSSSPYNSGTVHDKGQDAKHYRRTGPDGYNWGTMANGRFETEAYSHNPENLGNLPPGSLDAALAPGVETPPQLDLLVSSSPFGQQHTGAGGIGKHGTPKEQIYKETSHSSTGYQHQGNSPDNLANLPPGSLDATLVPGADLNIASPPYADGCTHTGGADPQPHRRQGRALPYVQYGADCSVSSPVYVNENIADARYLHFDERRKQQSIAHKQSHGIPEGYGTTPQNLGNLRPGRVEAVVQGDLGVSSPPWENQEPSHAQADTPSSRKLRAEAAAVRGRAFLSAEYGHTNGQLGNTQSDTFWSAAKTIISETYKLLRPGAHAIWVTKMYVRDSQLVDFPGDWRKLCEAIGFKTVHIHLAMLVERRTVLDLFEGTRDYEQWAESFFRRIHRRKSGIGIEFETVICMQKGYPPTPMPPDEAWEQLPLVEVAECGISSAPFIDEHAQAGRDPAFSTQARPGRSVCLFDEYGTAPGQLGVMPVGSLDATLSADLAISSSPYAGAGEVLGAHNGIDWTKAQAQTGHRLTPGRGMYRYGTNSNNLGNLPAGESPV